MSSALTPRDETPAEMSDITNRLDAVFEHLNSFARLAAHNEEMYQKWFTHMRSVEDAKNEIERLRQYKNLYRVLLRATTLKETPDTRGEADPSSSSTSNPAVGERR